MHSNALCSFILETPHPHPPPPTPQILSASDLLISVIIEVFVLWWKRGYHDCAHLFDDLGTSPTAYTNVDCKAYEVFISATKEYFVE